MKIIKKKIEALDFYFINEIRDGIYEILYAKDMIDEDDEPVGEILNDERVAFWSTDNCDHRLVIDFRDILFKGVIK